MSRPRTDILWISYDRRAVTELAIADNNFSDIISGSAESRPVNRNLSVGPLRDCSGESVVSSFSAANVTTTRVTNL